MAIKIAIVGVGNCASSLMQGLYYYKDKKEKAGLLRKNIGGYKLKDIEVVAAFDIDKRKIGKDISEAIFSKPNNTTIFQKNIPLTGVKVSRGPTIDGFPSHMKKYYEEKRFLESEQEPEDVSKILKETKPDILINYLPVGSQKATEYYANACLDAGVSFINAIPVFISSKEEYARKFEEAELVCIGDDIKAQLGATILHRVLTNLFEERGVRLDRTYQLNFGGNTDFLNMLERDRLGSKKISKTDAVQSQLKEPLDKNNIHIGPSDFIPWLNDNKICQLRMEGSNFGDVKVNVDLKLSVEDSPNSAGIMVDAIRTAKMALDKGYKGYLDEISSFGFKHPKNQYPDSKVFQKLNDFIDKNESEH